MLHYLLIIGCCIVVLFIWRSLSHIKNKVEKINTHITKLTDLLLFHLPQNTQQFPQSSFTNTQPPNKPSDFANSPPKTYLWTCDDPRAPYPVVHEPGCNHKGWFITELRAYLMELKVRNEILQHRLFGTHLPDGVTVDFFNPPKKDILDMYCSWKCRSHPHDGFHEIGCPHHIWTYNQLIGAITTQKGLHNTYQGMLKLEKATNDPITSTRFFGTNVRNAIQALKK